MQNKENLNFLYFILVILVMMLVPVAVVCLMGLYAGRVNTPVETVRVIRDTTYITVTDTVRITEFVEVERVVKDTVYIQEESGARTPVPMYNYRFREEGKYDIEAYGFNVKLLGVEVYPEKKVVCITNTVERTIVPKDKWSLYFKGGLSLIDNKWVPNMGLTLKAPKKWLFEADLGYFNGRLMYKFEVGYKLF